MPVTSLKKGYKLILMLLRLNVCNSVILPLLELRIFNAPIPFFILDCETMQKVD